MSEFDDGGDEFDPNQDEAAELERLERQVRELQVESARLEAQLDQVQAMARENAAEMARLRADMHELGRRMDQLRRRMHRDRWVNLLAPVLGLIVGALSVYLWMR